MAKALNGRGDRATELNQRVVNISPQHF
jgi:hypothetical protein